MKKLLMILALSALAIPTMAQETNRPCSMRDKKSHPEWNEKKRTQQQQRRRLQLMEKELKKIGITQKEKTQITELQKMYREKMMANERQTEILREKLSTLLNEGAPMETLEAAIQKVSAAQTEQLRILVRNRIEMERILGKEKYRQFMNNARLQYKKHGRRGGAGLPPMPRKAPPLPAPDAPPTP